MEVCYFVLSKYADVTELTSSDETSNGIAKWVHNAVHSLTSSDKEIILGGSMIASS